MTLPLESPPANTRMQSEERGIGRLRIQCDDRPGVVAAVSQFLAERGANIIELGQFSTDHEGGRFYQRTVFHLDGLEETRDVIASEFATLADRFSMSWQLNLACVPKRVAIMASRQDHCLLDLLWRYRRGELDMYPVVVISNHPDLAAEVDRFGVPYVHIPVTKETKSEAEERQLSLLAGQVDLLVMARYMQVLSDKFIAAVGCPVINIHHSFLPAFPGADPYAQAKARGVKLIGATGHYASEELDEGPIIEQDVVRVSQALSTHQLRRIGADVERSVLARAVQWHCEDRVFTHGNATVIL